MARTRNPTEYENPNHLYDADEMEILVNHYIINGRSNVKMMCHIDAYQHNGETLKQNLFQELDERIVNESKGENKINTIIIPLNLGNAHWTALYLDFTENQRKPTIRYIDPLGSKTIPWQVEEAITKVYPGVDIERNINISTKQIQRDSYNCGPWTIAILQHIVETNEVPPENFDITQRRKEDYDIIKQQLPLQPQHDVIVSHESQINEDNLFSYLSLPENKAIQELFDSHMAKEINRLHEKYSNKMNETELFTKARNSAYIQLKREGQLPDHVTLAEAIKGKEQVVYKR